MKTQKTFLFYFLLAIIFPSFITAQNIEVHNFIGKSQKDVIKTYGNPVHKDDSNPSMNCIFYQNNASTMIFVSDENGVYQAEATKSFDTQSEARAVINSFITGSIKDGFAVDSVSTSDFQLRKKGTKVQLQLYENKLTKNFEIRVKANKSES